MSKNKTMKDKLIQIYGKGCFFKRANIEERLEKQKIRIKSFKRFVEERKFSGKKISYQLTVHHLRHRSEGGDTSEKNCANIAEIAHQYLHSLDRADEEIINDMLREFKVNCLIMGGNEAQSFKIEQDTEFIAIPVFNLEENSELDIIRKSEKQKRREKYNKNKNPSRAKKKKELQELIDEYEEEL